VAVLTGGLTALVLALVEGNSWGWGSTEIVALLVGAGAALAAFVAIELRVKVPMVEFRFFTDRNFLGAVVVALIVSFSMLGVFFFLAIYMQDILHYSPLEAGIRFLPSTLMIVGVAPVAGRLADRFGPRWLIAGGLAIVAASLYTFSGIAVDSGYLDLLPGFVLLGIGIAMTMSPMTSAAMNAVPVEKAGIASGVLSMFRMVGGSLGVAVTGAIFQGSVGTSNFNAASPQQFVTALGHAMSVSAVVAVLGAAIGATAIRAKRDELSIEAVEADVNPGGSALAAQEAVAAGEPAR
jgi:MFS family permease